MIRAQDVVWLFLFSALAFVSPRRSGEEVFLLLCLALLQVLEPRIPAFSGDRGNYLAIAVKLGLGYLLIFFTGRIESSYYLILLLPVVSAATTLGVAGTALSALAACASYLSFLLMIDWQREFMPEDQIRELVLRIVFLIVVGYLTHTLAEANRREARRYQATSRQLADANRSLQEAEAAVRRSERLAALGQLTAGLAHELRNPLGTIRASAEMLEKNLPPDNDVAKEVAGFIRTEVDRTNSLVTRFLDFARPLSLRREITPLHEVVDRAVAALDRHNPPLPVTVYKNYSPDVLPFAFDGELIERVVYNLLLNAAQATPPGGAVTVKTRPAGDFVELSVIDRGAGIPPSQIENIFNPFFTTKRDGVGLGLAIVSKIVDEHRGSIDVESEPGAGTVFRLRLPSQP